MMISLPHVEGEIPTVPSEDDLVESHRPTAKQSLRNVHLLQVRRVLDQRLQAAPQGINVA